MPTQLPSNALIRYNQKHDSNFRFLLNEMNELVNARHKMPENDVRSELCYKFEHLRKAYSYDSISQTEALLSTPFLQEFSHMIKTTNGDFTLLTSICKLLTSLLKSCVRFKDTLPNLTPNIVTVVEGTLGTFQRSKDLVKYQCINSMVLQALSTYKHCPFLIDVWFSKSAPNIHSFPSFDYVVEHCYYYQDDFSDTSYKARLLKAVLGLCSICDPARTLLYDIKLENALLCFPNSLICTPSAPTKYIRQVSTSTIIPEQFSDNSIFSKYRQTLFYFITISKSCSNPNITQFYLDKLRQYLLSVLEKYYSERSEVFCSYFYETFKITLASTSSVENRIIINSIFADFRFQILIWSNLLCFNEIGFGHEFDKLVSRHSHKGVIEFLEMIFNSDCEIIQECIWLEDENYDVSAEDWFLKYAFYVKMNESDKVNTISRYLKEFMKLFTREGNDSFTLNTHGMFYHFLLARMNLFYFYFPSENKVFLDLVDSLIIQTRGKLITGGSHLVESIKRLDAFRDTNKRLTTEWVCFPLNNIPSLSNFEELQLWMEEQNRNTSKAKIITRSYDENRMILSNFCLRCYCQLKASRIVSDP
ncbi:unnamed protein product [Ambrosiozyma monospora]|uniref:Unnamed protein product n=1 Tax=Ambrosiozyma monospora TaxID=43982 RepID=A0ACB5SZR8_AMBMO|nr:unnamed protein product [Ambrosiozyma monospora]